MLIDKIKQLAGEIYPEAVLIRRHLHSNPELSFQEFKTSDFVYQYLVDLGVSVQKMAITGVVASIKGNMPSDAVVALRADMDALPITEENEIAYKSTNNGVMHACGHDAHTASLLGVARILNSLRSEFGGTIKLIFQPAEEVLPGGASMMIREGVLQDLRPNAVIGQHVLPAIEAGKIGIRSGRFMASMDEIYATVYGKGGHGAQPEFNVDPVLIASHIVVALQQVVSRMANPKTPTVLSFGKVIANGATNIIPDQVSLEGTFRTLNEEWRAEAHVKLKKMAEGIAESMGGRCEFNIVKGYPCLENEKELSEKIRCFAGEYMGKENVLEWEIWMASEDFAYYSQEISSCFYLLGVGNKQKGINSSLHTPTFNVDEEALLLSMGLMTYLAIKQLSN